MRKPEEPPAGQVHARPHNGVGGDGWGNRSCGRDISVGGQARSCDPLNHRYFLGRKLLPPRALPLLRDRSARTIGPRVWSWCRIGWQQCIRVVLTDVRTDSRELALRIGNQILIINPQVFWTMLGLFRCPIKPYPKHRPIDNAFGSPWHSPQGSDNVTGIPHQMNDGSAWIPLA